MIHHKVLGYSMFRQTELLRGLVPNPTIGFNSGDGYHWWWNTQHRLDDLSICGGWTSTDKLWIIGIQTTTAENVAKVLRPSIASHSDDHFRKAAPSNSSFDRFACVSSAGAGGCPIFWIHGIYYWWCPSYFVPLVTSMLEVCWCRYFLIYHDDSWYILIYHDVSTEIIRSHQISCEALQTTRDFIGRPLGITPHSFTSKAMKLGKKRIIVRAPGGGWKLGLTIYIWSTRISMYVYIII